MDKLLENAKAKKRLGKLNFILQRGIPFNAPHGIKLTELSYERVAAIIPYKRKNLNHIKGIHACGLATVAEFCSGIALLNALGTRKYRLIMSTLRMEYHYQAKKSATASYEFDSRAADEKVVQPLKQNESVVIECEVPVHDEDRNHLCTAYVLWQVKPWDKVKTKS